MSIAKSDITIMLYNADNVNVATAITDVNGMVNFPNVPVGIYKATATLPSGYTVDFGNFENSIVDSNTTNNSLTSDIELAVVAGLDVTMNSSVAATIIIGATIPLTIAFSSVTPHGCNITLMSNVPVASEIVVSLDYYIENVVSGETPTPITVPVTSAFTMNIGDIISNIVTIENIHIENPINSESRFRYTVVSRTPGRIVITLPGDLIIDSY